MTDVDTGERRRIRPGRSGTARTVVGLLLGTTAYIVPFGAIAGVLLPARIAQIDPADKAVLVAVLAAGTAVAGLLGNVVFGTLSDLTRPRWGSRLPWLVAGATGGALLLVPLAAAGTLVELLVWWCLAVFTINAVTVVVIAVLPDRVPCGRRATFSAVAGAGNLLGNALGTTLGAWLLPRPGLGVLLAAGALLVLALIAAAALHGGAELEPDPAVPDRTVLRARDRVRPPRGVPDFYRALGGRLLLVLAYFMVYAFKLYIVTDHLRLDTAATTRALTLTSGVLLVSALVGGAIAGPLSDRWRRRRPFVVGAALLLLVATAAPLATPTLGGLVAYSVVGGLAFGVFYAVDAALMSEVLPRDAQRGRDLGILNTASVGGQLLGPAASAALLALGAGFGPVFVGAIIACLGGAACLARIRSVP